MCTVKSIFIFIPILIIKLAVTHSKDDRYQRIGICLLCVLLLTQVPSFSDSNSWKLLFQPRYRAVYSIATYENDLFVGTQHGVYVSKDNGKTFKDFGSSQLDKDISGYSKINWIYIDEEGEKIYIATSNGAYWSGIEKPNWYKFFENVKVETNEINSLLKEENKVYLCTNDGFWICDLKSDFCERENNGLEADNATGNYIVKNILRLEDNLFLATSNGVFVFDSSKKTWQKRSNGIQRLGDGQINANHLLLDNEGLIWLACDSGIYFTHDKGITWHKLTKGINQSGEDFLRAFYLLFEKGRNTIYAGTDSGIYLLNKEKDLHWQDFFSGIRSQNGLKNIYSLLTFNDKYLAATDEGLFENQFKYELSNVSTLLLKGKIENDFAYLEEIEPSIVEVHKQALKFASLPTNKDYKRYRLQARLRNVIPRIGFDLNSTGTNTNYYESRKGISTNVALNNEFDAGKLTRLQNDGKSFKQLSILWNTNNFIYDDEIKDILNQARLTANIRENLLDDVTKIYFQRRKLQLEKLLTPSTSILENIEKDMQIAELSGQLDSRTGGWFSKEVGKRKEIYQRKNIYE